MNRSRLFHEDQIEEAVSAGLLILSGLCYLAPASWPQFSIALSGFVLTAIWGIFSKHWKLLRGDKVALGCAALFFLYHRWGAVAPVPALKHGLSLFLIWMVCAVFRRLRPPPVRALIAVELILLGGVLLQAMLPGLHYQFMEFSGYDYWMIRSRGFSSFTNEPSSLAKIASGLAVLTFYCTEKKTLPRVTSMFLAALLIFLSHSWTGVLLLALALFGLSWVQFRNVLKAVPAVALALLCVWIIPSGAGSHSVVRESTGGNSPSGAVADMSLMCRWVPLLMGTLHTIEHPFGNGLARLREADLLELSSKYNIAGRLDEWWARQGFNEKVRARRASFFQKYIGMSSGTSGRLVATSLFRMGIVFPVCFVLFLWGLGLFRWRLLPVTAWIVAFVIMSSGVIIPVFWLVAGCAGRDEDRRKND